MDDDKKVQGEETTPEKIEYREEEPSAGSPDNGENEESEVRPEPVKAEKDAYVPRPRKSRARGRSRKRKRKPVGKILAIAAAVLIVGAAAAYGAGMIYYSSRFLPGTFVDNVLVENMTREEASARLTQYYAPMDAKFHVISRTGDLETVDLSKAALTRVYRRLPQIIAEQNKLTFLPEKDTFKFYEAEHDVKIGDEAAFEEAVLSMKMADQNAKEPTDARVEQDAASGQYVVVPEEDGDRVIPEVFVSVVKDAVERGDNTLVLTEEDEQEIYAKPGVYADDADVVGFVDRMNSLENIHAKLDLGADTVLEIPVEEIRGMLVGELLEQKAEAPRVTAAIDREKFDKYMRRLDGMYSTKGKTGVRYFFSCTGKKELVHTDYGWEMDVEATGEALYTMLNDAAMKMLVNSGYLEKSASREVAAVWKQEALSHEKGHDTGMTWAEVDLANQKMRMVVDGEMVLESNVVTGKGEDRTKLTPPGIYKIKLKALNRDLKGYNADGSLAYSSHVQYWMPFNNNIGFHDASWRGSFGGDIHTWSGSHGCVNMPTKNAQLLYGYVYKDMPVIVYAGTKEEAEKKAS